MDGGGPREEQKHQLKTTTFQEEGEEEGKG
jgi:hypothetical protein